MMLRLFFLLGFLIPFSAYAIDDERVIEKMVQTSSLSAEQIRANYKDGCASGAHQAMLICASFGYTAADLELNDLYKELLQQLKPTHTKEKLMRAQKAWVKFRDLVCDYESDGYSGGRDESMVGYSCKAKFTLERNKQLTKYLECKQPGCPGEW